MVLYTKSIFAPKSSEDGIRISVMSRHTLNDGKTLDERITNESYDEHLVALVPPEKLIGTYLQGQISFATYLSCYNMYLKREQEEAIVGLARRAMKEDIFLFYIKCKYC